MDIKFLFYGILCIIALIFLIRFGNKESVLIKEESYYHKLISLKLSTRILIIILAWIFSAKWIITAYKYNYKGISILGMLPFLIICIGVVNIPIEEYFRKKILKSSYSNSIKDWLDFFNLLFTAYLIFVEFFIIGYSIILARYFHLI